MTTIQTLKNSNRVLSSFLIQKGPWLFLAVFMLLMVLGCTPKSRHDIAILYTRREPIMPALPKDCCHWALLDNFKPTGEKAKTVIVAGHGLPPYFANAEVTQVAQAVASFEPELIVMNSCYGATSDLMQAFVEAGLKHVHVVAAPFPIYQPGFVYEDDFLKPNSSLKQRIQAVRTDPPYPILRWQLNAKSLEKVQSEVDQMPPEELKKRLRRVQPALVRIPFPTPLEQNSELLVPVPIERFKKSSVPQPSQQK